MAPSDFNDVSRRLKCSLQSDFKNDKFATVATPEKVLTSDNLRVVYQSLAILEGVGELESTIKEDEFVESVERKKLHTFLAVLLYANCSAHAVLTFVSKLVRGDAVGTAPDNHHYAGPPYSLPVDKTYLAKLFDDDRETVTSFYQAQPHFSTVVLRAGESVKMKDDELRPLPYLEDDNIGKGSFGNVFKVKIAEGHFVTQGNPNRMAQVVARKDYVYEDDAKQSFEDEIRAMAKISGGILKHDNILQSLGTLEIEGKTPKFSLFMPLAIGDLNAYMNANQDKLYVAADADARRRLIRSALGLAQGLQYLHRGIVTPDGERLVCYHMDLKPANILLFPDDRRGDEPPHEDDRIWKISDFGISRVKEIQATTGRDKELDFRKLFKSTSEHKEYGASATRNQRGQGTYLPSESERSTKQMNDKSDIWSLGCVISELFTYMEEGSPGLDAYRKRRSGGRDVDVFYQRRRFKHDFEINAEVESQHERLIKAAAKRGPWEKQAVRFMLDFLEQRVLQTDKDKRCNAADVADCLMETRRKYKTQSPEKAVSTSPLMGRFPWPFRPKPSVTQIVEKWKLGIDRTTSLKGCESSPDGTVIAYWSDSKIFVFLGSVSTSDERRHRESGTDSRSDSTSSRRQAGLEPVVRGLPEEPGQTWRAIKLTNRHLVATTKGGNFNCYIFDISEADNKLDRYNTEPFSRPIHMLAVSPDGKSIACILANEEDGTRGSLWTANIRQTWAQLDGGGTNAGIQLVDHKLFPLEYSAKEALNLTILPGNKALIAHRSQNPSSPLLIDLFVSQSAQWQRAGTARVEIEDADPDYARYFSDMSFYQGKDKLEAIVVVQGEYICKIQLPELPNQDGKISHSRIKSHRILRVVVDERLGRLFALGTRSGSRMLFLLDIGSPGLGHSKVREEAELPGLKEPDELKLRVCHSSSEEFALVTAVTPLGMHSVYRVGLGRSPRHGS